MPMPPSPLPDVQKIEDLFSNHPASAHITSAFRICVDIERATEDNKKKMYARVIGYLIIHAPSHQSQSCIIRDIVSCNESVEKLLDLGEFYCDHLIRPFKKYKGRTPVPSQHPSRPSFNRLQDMISGMLVETPKNHQEAKKNALVRDGFRCMVSGKYDSYSVENNTEFLDQIEAAGLPVDITQCAHIFSESTNYDVATKDAKREYAAGAWAVLDRFGYKSIREELMGPKAHRLENILTLSVQAHDKFDCLNIWFEETDIKDQYDIRTTNPRFIFNTLQYPRRVTFKTERPDLPLPSPTYLGIHAACAKVAHLSGAGEYIDKILRELESTDVLASDGGSAALLKDVLLPLQAMSVGA